MKKFFAIIISFLSLYSTILLSKDDSAFISKDYDHFKVRLMDVYLQSTYYLPITDYKINDNLKAYPGTAKAFAIEYAHSLHFSSFLAFITPLTAENVKDKNGTSLDSFDFTKALLFGPIYHALQFQLTENTTYEASLSLDIMMPFNFDSGLDIYPASLIRQEIQRDNFSILVDLGCTGCTIDGISFAAVGFGYLM